MQKLMFGSRRALRGRRVVRIVEIRDRAKWIGEGRVRRESEGFFRRILPGVQCVGVLAVFLAVVVAFKNGYQASHSAEENRILSVRPVVILTTTGWGGIGSEASWQLKNVGNGLAFSVYCKIDSSDLKAVLDRRHKVRWPSKIGGNPVSERDIDDISGYDWKVCQSLLEGALVACLGKGEETYIGPSGTFFARAFQALADYSIYYMDVYGNSYATDYVGERHSSRRMKPGDRGFAIYQSRLRPKG